MKSILYSLVLLLSILALAACGANDPKRDAPRPATVDASAPDVVVAFPDDFSNVASKCVGHGYRAFVTTHGGDKDSGNMTIEKDPACR